MTTTTTLSNLTGDYVLDPSHTRLGFVARHAMATKVRGRFDEFEGRVHLDGDDPSRSSAQLTIRARSIQTRNRRRDRDLRTKLLDVSHHPTITFASTKVEQVAETSFTVSGDLTIRGVSKPIAIDVAVIGATQDPANGRVHFAGAVTISRRERGVRGNVAVDALISDRVRLEIAVTALRQS